MLSENTPRTYASAFVGVFVRLRGQGTRFCKWKVGALPILLLALLCEDGPLANAFPPCMGETLRLAPWNQVDDPLGANGQPLLTGTSHLTWDMGLAVSWYVQETVPYFSVVPAVAWVQAPPHPAHLSALRGSGCSPHPLSQGREASGLSESRRLVAAAPLAGASPVVSPVPRASYWSVLDFRALFSMLAEKFNCTSKETWPRATGSVHL